LALCAATALPVWAQDTGGVLLTFGLSQNVSLIDNQGFAPSSPGTTLRTTTDLSFGLSSETRSSSLELTAITSLEGIDRPGRSDFEVTAGEPRFSLRYSTNSVASTLSANIGYSQRDITYIDPLELCGDVNGGSSLTGDCLDLSGTGTRNRLSYGASLSIRDNRPFGLTFSASVLDLDYIDATTPILIDSTRTELGIAARLDINPATQAILSLDHERFETEDNTSRNTTLSGDVTFSRPNGSLGFGLSATDTRVGTRLGLSFSRAYQLPGDVSMSASLGVTRPAASDDLYVTTGFSYARPLPNGEINARLDRSFGSGTDGAEQIQTSLSVSSSHALTPLATLGLNAAFAQTEQTAADETTSLASLGATLDYQLSPDWSLSAGVTIESRDTSDTQRAERSTLSVTMARDFSFRP